MRASKARTASCRRLWTFAQCARRRRQAAADAGFDRRNAAGGAGARAARSISTLKQANYDYERIQYNTVVSAGMKMLNALEAVPADAAGRAGTHARRTVDPDPRRSTR